MRKRVVIRIVGLLLCLLWIFPIGVGVVAEQVIVVPETEGIFRYVEEFDGIYIAGIETDQALVTIPKTIQGIPVVGFSETNQMPDCVTAFSVEKGHSFLTAINGVLYNADHSVLVRVPVGMAGVLTISDGVIAIGKGAASGCSKITHVEFPVSLREVGAHAFSFCSGLMAVSLPQGVKTLGIEAFWQCGNLRRISLPDSLESFTRTVFEGSEYYYNPKNWDNGVLYIDHHLISGENFTGLEYTVRQGTVTVCSQAFLGREYLISLTLPESLRDIGSLAFPRVETVLGFPRNGPVLGYKGLSDGVICVTDFRADESTFGTTA
ncbi:MAG: leucine-rich repeat domain-containing protein, partial [Clostridia bacterium]|nr:leucine-rich repeat domain-containing protein [Clostridia bacterium]